MSPTMTQYPFLSFLKSSVVELPTPSNISYWWNLGSLLGICLGVQITTGLFLSMHYTGDIAMAFNSVSHISRDVNFGWLLRMVHANGASFFFVCLYMHVGRGLYYGSYTNLPVWWVGVSLLICSMATAFLGYVLPWGQMSFWGATVITSLFSAIPMAGLDIVSWLWGGFAVDNATLSRFFSLHFFLPFYMAALVFLHLFLLHSTGSSNPLGTNPNYDKIPFHPYFTTKDLLGFLIYAFFLMMISLLMPWVLGDPENFIPANPLVTPVHIQPEWYFLFAYAILRAIPNKLGGVMALFASVLILVPLVLHKPVKFLGLAFYPLSKFFFFSLISTIFLLSWIGTRPVEDPYILVGQGLTFFYFVYFSAYVKVMGFADNLSN